MSKPSRRLRILTWHVHGNYLYYLSQIPHDLYLVTKPGNPPGYAGAGGSLPWGANVFEIPAMEVAFHEFDVVLYQHRIQWEDDRLNLLTDAQRQLPTVYLEHDPPQENAFSQRHWVEDVNVQFVHVTHFNDLMWDNGDVHTRVIEHGVIVPEGVRYSGQHDKGIVVVNHLRQRGRRLGVDVFADMRRHVPLDLVGMDAKSMGGIGEVDNMALAQFTSEYRFFFNPIRWTSLGLAVVEAMMIGMPIVGLASTEMVTVIRNGVNGYVDTDKTRLREVMNHLIADRAEAALWGEGARRTALERFNIARFVEDWNRTLADVAQ